MIEMSKVEKWQLSDYYQTRREKIIGLLLGELIFLKNHIKQIHSVTQQRQFETGLEKIDYILGLLKKNEEELPEDIFDKIINLVYNILKEIVIELEKELEI
ncbi:MAG: hypothetical protein MUP85_02475 [Candidatus Lokiarchaeota archaeon]|nr:hypothetical protein [Candidatus Lokiarchaeota archaeon]